MIKNPKYATFMNEVESYISNLSEEELKQVILNLAEKQNIKDRNLFLDYIKEGYQYSSDPGEPAILPGESPAKFIARIEEFEKRIRSGEFYDEDRSSWAYEREERSHWGRDRYYDDFDDDIDFSDEDYVVEAETFLDRAKQLFRSQDNQTALTAYKMLFNIFENPEFYDGEEYFIYGFSFNEAIDQNFLKEHKTIFLRCRYLNCADCNDFSDLYRTLCNENDIFLSDIIEIDRSQLPNLDDFMTGFIQFLSADPKYDPHLIDALFVKGGMEEIKHYAYANGDKHPAVFLYYYEFAKEDKSTQADRVNIILDGIKIIPEKYIIRSYLGLDLMNIAKELNDKKNLLIGYSTAFYSNPTLRDLAIYIHFIVTENMTSEIEKLKDYLNKIDIPRGDSYYYAIGGIHEHRNIFSLEIAQIGAKALIVGKFLLDDVAVFIDHIDPKHFLGFSGAKKYIAIITALTLKAITRGATAIVVDILVDHYCVDVQSNEYNTLKKMLADRSHSLSLDQAFIQKALDKIESLAVNRVSHILTNKLRGGYDSACLLLVACAEVRQLVTKDGNDLVRRIDSEYKRFSAFRKPLKSLTSESRLLVSIK